MIKLLYDKYIYEHSNKVSDNYKIVRSIGKGAFGTVYLTYDNDGSYYASKVEITKRIFKIN